MDDLFESGINQPESHWADLPYWAKMSTWTCDEAPALMLGINPRHVQASKTLLDEPTSMDAIYFDVRELAIRAIAARRIQHDMTPLQWMEWAKELDLPVVDSVEPAVREWAGRSKIPASAEAKRIAELESSNDDLRRHWKAGQKSQLRRSSRERANAIRC